MLTSKFLSMEFPPSGTQFRDRGLYSYLHCSQEPHLKEDTEPQPSGRLCLSSFFSSPPETLLKRAAPWPHSSPLASLWSLSFPSRLGFLQPAWQAFLQSELGFIRNTDLYSLKGRKRKMRAGETTPRWMWRGDFWEPGRAPHGLPPDEEVTAWNRTTSRTQTQLRPARQESEAFGYEAQHQAKRPRAVGYEPSWVTISLAASVCKAWQRAKKASLEIQLAKHWLQRILWENASLQIRATV